MQNALKIFAALAFIILGNACRTDKEEVVLKGIEYYPIKTGTVRFYQIDSFFYDNYTNETDTVSYECRELVQSTFVDPGGDTTYRIELSTYSIEKAEWIVQKVFTRKTNGNYAIENIDNTPEVKLLFPISKYKTKGSSYVWNINMYTSNEATNVKYTSVFTSYYNGLTAYNDCVVIGLQKPETGIVHNIREEVYAKNVGLVYRHIDKSDYLLDSNSRNGYEVFVRLKP